MQHVSKRKLTIKCSVNLQSFFYTPLDLLEKIMMHFVENKIDGVHILTIKGNLVQKEDTDKLQERLLALMEKNKAKSIVIDLKHVSIISSLGIGGVIRALRTVKESGGHLKLSAVNASVKKVFDITKLNELIDIFDTSDGGGIRMSPDVIFMSDLKDQLVSEKGFTTQEQHCTTYFELFAGTDLWEQEEYEDLGTEGCLDKHDDVCM